MFVLFLSTDVVTERLWILSLGEISFTSAQIKDDFVINSLTLARKRFVAKLFTHVVGLAYGS